MEGAPHESRLADRVARRGERDPQFPTDAWRKMDDPRIGIEVRIARSIETDVGELQDRVFDCDRRELDSSIHRLGGKAVEELHGRLLVKKRAVKICKISQLHGMVARGEQPTLVAIDHRQAVLAHDAIGLPVDRIHLMIEEEIEGAVGHLQIPVPLLWCLSDIVSDHPRGKSLLYHPEVLVPPSDRARPPVEIRKGSAVHRVVGAVLQEMVHQRVSGVAILGAIQVEQVGSLQYPCGLEPMADVHGGISVVDLPVGRK